MSERKTVSVMIPCYNEEENVRPIYEAVRKQLLDLPYDYEILFIDNKSQDRTREIIREICAEDKRVKAIFNVKNFGQFNSPYYAMLQTSGDCTITMCADFQDPPELIPRFIAAWEEGYKIVIGRKTKSRENPFVYWLRGCYYKLIKKMSSTDQIEQFTGFGLYDKSFIQTLRDLKDPTPFIRGIVAELGPERKEIEYEQPQRRAGKTHNNWYTLYDAAMLSFTSYTKAGLRLATFFGFIVAGLSFPDRPVLSGGEASLLGSLHRGLRADHDRRFLYGRGAAGLPRLSRGVCHGHQCPRHEPASGRGGRTDQL